MSAPQGRTKRGFVGDDDEAMSVVGQRVWYIDQIEAVGVVKSAIEANGRVLGYVIEDERSRDDLPLLHRVQANRIRRYGERHFLVPSWFSKADQSSRELEKQLTRGLPPDHDRKFWNSLAARNGQAVLDNVLRRTSPSTYSVVGQLAGTAESLSQDLARAAVTFRRAQRAVVANQGVMAPDEYAEFVDQVRKWGRTVRLILMALESYSRALPRAQIDLRNPDAPLPSEAIYIALEALLDIHTPAGEGRARERPLAAAAEAQSFSEVFGDEGGWDAGGGFETVGDTADEHAEFKAVQPLDEYEEDGFEALPDAPAAEAFEPVAEETAGFEEVGDWSSATETREPFVEVPAPAPLAAAPSPAVKPAAPKTSAPPVPPAPTKGAPTAPATAAPKVESLPEDDDDERAFSSARKGSAVRSGSSWLTPPSPPAPAPATARQVERQEKMRDKPDLEAIIAASLGKTPKKSPSKASQGEISTSQEYAAPRFASDALSRELASLLEKSRKK